MRKFMIPYYLILIAVSISLGLSATKLNLKAPLLALGIYCFLFGVFGGIVYCLRGYYLHTPLHKDWDDRWDVWYYVMPLISGMTGLISLIFIKAMLLLFSTGATIGADNLMAYFAVAVISGYNAQHFLKKFENISKTAVGIEEKK